MLETNKIYNMDCLKGLKLLDNNSIDCVVTSPPYNTGNRNDCMINAKYKDYNDDLTEEEYIKLNIDLFKLLENKLNNKGIIAYNMSYSTKYPDLLYKVIYNIINKTQFNIYDTIVWKKRNAIPLNSHPTGHTRLCEFVYIFAKNKNFNCYKKYSINKKTNQKFFKNYVNIIEKKNNDGSIKEHKATFSSDFVKYFVELYSKSSNIVLDPFMGSGTTAVACKELQRNYIGFEISKEYCDIAEERINNTNVSQDIKKWF